MPDVNPSSEKGLIRFFYAARHVERRPTTNTRRGRSPQGQREKLVEAANQLRSLLERETQGRVSVNSFVGQYLPLLSFPSGLTDALASGRISLQEAVQLARLTPQRLDCSGRRTRQASRVAHFPPRRAGLTNATALPGQKAARGITVPDITGGLASVVSMVDELLDVAPSDARHMFWEEMKRLFFAMREVEPEDLDDETMDDFLKAMG